MGIVEVAALAASAEGGPPAAISTATCSGDEFGGEVTQLLIATFRPPKRDHQILSLDKSGFAQPVAERGDETCGFSGRAGAKKPDHRHGRLLRARRQRPRRRAAQAANEISTIKRTARHVFPRLAGRHLSTLSPLLGPILGTILKCSESR